MELKLTMALEVFKTLNILNPRCMHDLSYIHARPYLGSSSPRRPNNIAVLGTITSTDGTKSLRSLGSQIWNSLPEYIKAETPYKHFRIWLILALVKNASATCVNILKHSMPLNSTWIRCYSDMIYFCCSD